ncbi:hypothetical protein OHA98_38595 [Streptomyces sp. NBC_00654]|uniref:hypothetical protein n=1 Tax=Streptomyces sp. NBC_00654 TaxID=2975799 RepID=UPI0022568AD3|nr:hypothetical protein [Streptomyces sp. NBC_00654]MCX4970559.1 hypothetical protein [Streptomyces sp. NBC_00654]
MSEPDTDFTIVPSTCTQGPVHIVLGADRATGSIVLGTVTDRSPTAVIEEFLATRRTS